MKGYARGQKISLVLAVALLFSTVFSYFGISRLSAYAEDLPPEYDASIHEDLTPHVTVTRNGTYQAFTGILAENGTTGNIDYTFSTGMASGSEYYISADIRVDNAEDTNTFSPMFFLRGTTKKVGFVFRGNGTYVVNEGINGIKDPNNQSSWKDVKRVIGKTHHVVIHSASDFISVWVDGDLVYDHYDLKNSASGDYSGLAANPVIRFVQGNTGTTVAKVDNIRIYKEKEEENPDIPRYNPETDQDLTENMTVTRNNTQISYTGVLEEFQTTGNINYKFNMPSLKSNDTYYIRASVRVDSQEDANSTPLIHFRSDGTTSVGLAFRGGGTYIVNQNIFDIKDENGNSSWRSAARVVGRTHTIVIKSTPETVSVWIDGSLVYDEFNLKNSGSGDLSGLPNDLTIRFVQGTKGVTISKTFNLQVWKLKETVIPARPEPEYNSETDALLSENMTYWKDNVSYQYNGEEITESGKSGSKYYFFSTPLEGNKPYVLSAEINTIQQNVFWAGVRLVIRAGNAGGINGEVYILLRGDGTFIFGTNGSTTYTIAHSTLTRALGKNYRLTVENTEDSISLWVDGELIFDAVSLKYKHSDESILDFGALPVNPRLCFAYGDGNGTSEFKVNNIRLWTDKTNVPIKRPEPEFNSETDALLSDGMAYWKDNLPYQYKGEEIVESGTQGVKNYYLVTPLGGTVPYVLSAEINTIQQNVFWAGVRLGIRAGNAGGINGEVYILLRGDGTFIFGTNGSTTYTIAHSTLTRALGKNYRLTVENTEDSISLWVDGELIFDAVSLKYKHSDESILDFGALPVNPRLCFAYGDGNGTSEFRVNNIKLWTDKGNVPEDIKKEPVFDPEKHKAYHNTMEVRREGEVIPLPGVIKETGRKNIEYSFNTGLTRNAIFYYSAEFQVDAAAANWCSPRFILRSGTPQGQSPTNISVAMRGDGTFILLKNGNAISESGGNWNLKRLLSTNYKITIKSTPSTVSVWVNSVLVFDEVHLQEYSNLRAAPGLLFVLGDSSTQSDSSITVKKICIWNDGGSENPPYTEIDPTEEPRFNSASDKNYASSMKIQRNGVDYKYTGIISEKGGTNVTYTFSTGLTKHATYYYSADVRIDAAAANWCSPVLVIRSGYTKNGTSESLRVALRKTGLFILNSKGSSISPSAANWDFKAVEGRTYHITIKSTPNYVSVWVDGVLYFDRISIGDYAGLAAAPGIIFAMGDTSTAGKVSHHTVKNIILWNNGTSENPPLAAYEAVEDMISELPEVSKLRDRHYKDIEKARAAYNALSAEDKKRVSQKALEKLLALEEKMAKRKSFVLPKPSSSDTMYSDNMMVLKNNLVYLDYNKSKKITNTEVSEYNNYSFVTGLNKYSTYYMSMDIACDETDAAWQGFRIIFRKNSSTTLTVAFLRKGVSILVNGTSAIVKDEVFERSPGETYNVVIRSSNTSITVWVDGELIFGDEYLGEHANLPAQPGINFSQAKGFAKNIKIWSSNKAQEQEQQVTAPDEEYIPLALGKDASGSFENTDMLLDKTYRFVTSLGKDEPFNYEATVTLKSANSQKDGIWLLVKSMDTVSREADLGVLITPEKASLQLSDGTVLASENHGLALGTDYAVQLTVSTNSMSMKIGDKDIFKDVSFEQYALANRPGLRFQKAAGSVKNIRIYSERKETPAISEEEAKGKFPWWIIPAACLPVALAAVVCIVLYKRKKKITE